MEEEQDALDNMPESLQEGERGQQMQEYIDTMDDVRYNIDDIDITSLCDLLGDIIS